MLHLMCHQIALPDRHRDVSSKAMAKVLARGVMLLWTVATVTACRVHAQDAQGKSIVNSTPAVRCLPGGDGYFRARLAGTLQAELDWGNEGTECTGAVRPGDQGIRMRFTRKAANGEQLALVFGIATLREGQQHAKAVPVNVTLIREGAGEFYGTQGDDKCMLDEVWQQPIVGIPHKARSYRVVARGFCMEPARAVRGEGAVLISRFDYAGRVDFDDANNPDDPVVAQR